MHIVIMLVGDARTVAPLRRRIRASVLQVFGDASLSFKTLPPDTAIFDDAVEEFHSAAAIAEEAQRESGADMQAYVASVSVTLSDSKSDDEMSVPLIVVAVAHPGGIGAVTITSLVHALRLPKAAAYALLRTLEDLASEMRPRTRDARNQVAARLASAIIKPLLPAPP